MHIYAETDAVFEMLMRRLGRDIPPFRLQRRVLFTCDGSEAVVKAVDVHDPSVEVGVLAAVAPQPIEISQEDRVRAIWGNTAHRLPLDRKKSARCTLHFVGHYAEPDLTLDVDLSVGPQDYVLSFAPGLAQKSWALERVRPADGAAIIAGRDVEYGASHRRYVVTQTALKQGGGPQAQEREAPLELEEAEALVERAFRESRLAAQAENRAKATAKAAAAPKAAGRTKAASPKLGMAQAKAAPLAARAYPPVSSSSSKPAGKRLPDGSSDPKSGGVRMGGGRVAGKR
jgi:hypothetical protein